MINPFKIKRIAALMLSPLFTVIAFFIGLRFYNFVIALIIMLVALIISYFIGSLLLKNPFRSMLEGKGLLAFVIDSTGIIRPFNVGLKDPYIVGKVAGKDIQDIFDRDTVLQLAPPRKNSTALKVNQDGGITITLDENNYNKARFALFHYPVLIWNNQLKQIVTKDFFSSAEKDAWAEHGVLYLNKQLEDLNRYLLNFGRYIVENLKPKGSFLSNRWVLIILFVFLGVLLLMFAPSIIEVIKNIMQPAQEAVKGAASDGVINIIG